VKYAKNQNTDRAEEINVHQDNYKNKMAEAKKRKRFFEVSVPLIGKEIHLFALTQEELNGKLIQYDLTRLLRGKNSILTLKVSVNDKVISTTPKEMKLLPYFLKKMVRKGTNYVEDSFSVECKDAKIRIKPLLVTRRKVSRKVRKALRNQAREELINYVKNKTIENIFADLLQNKLQKPLSLKLKKIYPLSLCEIKVLKVEKPLEKKSVKKEETSKEKKEKVKTPKEENAEDILAEAEEIETSEEK